jgi:nucleotide-binding universal stress UspA family protein
MKRIAVAVDGSASAAAALRWAGELAEATGAETVALSIVAHQASETPSDNIDRLVAGRERIMSEQWLPESGVDPDTVSVAVTAGDPRQALLAEAESHGADLLVLGRSGAGGRPGFLHLGSVVEHIAHHLTIPLAVVPSGWLGATRRILIGVDGSDESAKAISWVTDVGPALGAMALAVQVEEPFLEWTPADSPDNWRRDVEREIVERTADLAAAGVEVKAIAARDLQPADALVGVASGRHVDLLVIGTRGIGGFLGLRVGGVAIKVLHRAGVPLVLVPAG